MKGLKTLLVLALGLCIIPAVCAKEGGDQYPFGAENWFTGATPPPGLTFINYAGYYSGELKNSYGGTALINGAPAKVDASWDALRFVEMTNYKFLGADWGMHIIIPGVTQSINMGGEGERRNVYGLGDITVDPFVLGWHHPQWHMVTAFDVDLPTGHYIQDDPRTSIGAHYYSFEPLICFSYMPKTGWEASIKLMYNMKTTNGDTNYHSGQEFHTDYVAGKHVGRWMLGASGYALKQTTADTVNGVTVPAAFGIYDQGREGQVIALGPTVGYEAKNHIMFNLHWQHEMEVRNRFGGEKVWFKLIVPITISPAKKS
jgi:hypothetical protein